MTEALHPVQQWPASPPVDAAPIVRHLLDGDGEMAALTRSLDWSATPLGPLDRWPQSLKTVASVCLHSRFPMLIWWGPELVMLYNDAYRPILGQQKHPGALGQQGQACWPEIWDFIGPLLNGVLSGGKATWSADQLLMLERNGFAEECFFTFSYSPIFDESGGVGGVFTAVTETTERVVNERRANTLRRLADALEDLSDITEIVRSSVAVLAEDERDAAWVGIADATQLPADGFVCESGPALANRLRVDAGFLAALEATIAAADSQCVTVTSPAGPRVFLVLKPVDKGVDGNPSHVLVVALNAHRPDDPGYRSFIGAAADRISTSLNNARARSAQRHREEALAELDRVKTTFFSNVSHELRTPLSLIIGPIEEALPVLADTGAAGMLSMAHRNAMRLRKLVDSLLDFSRLEAGKLKAQLQPTDLTEATVDIAALFRSTIEAAGLRFQVRCEPMSRPVAVDRDMWEKIVVNFLSNAYKFTLEGEIELELKTVGDQVELSVRDTGVGIAAHDAARIFERFYRVERTAGRSDEGAGIGLALVKELVGLHGGSVEVVSTLGQGSTFTVLLPRSVAAAAVVAAPRDRQPSLQAAADDGLGPFPSSAASPPATGVTAGSAAVVLVVDDNADMAAFLARVLSPRWSVEFARDGIEALASIEKRRPDVVLSDIMMPRLDGLGLLRRLRADPTTRSLPVIFQSARADEQARVEGLNAGADDYLTKPFSARELLARLENQLMRVRLVEMDESINRKLASVFSHAPVGIALLDGPEHRYEFVNADYERLVPGHALIGRTLREVFPELEGQGIVELLDGVYSSGTPHIARSLKIDLMSTATGTLETYYFDLVYQPMPGPDGRTRGVAVVAFDVTAMNEARRAAETANRTKDEFIAMLGHELRNPLAPIVTALQLMRTRSGDVAIQERGIIERQVKHMVRLVDDLLDVARITRGDFDLQRHPIEVWNLVSKAIETASPLLEQKRHTLQVRVPTYGLMVNGDSMRVTQVFSNLLTNAAKFTDVGGEIHVEGTSVNGSVEVKVRDNGIGMSDSELTSVFEMFTQGRQTLDRPQGGLGLGLTIAKSLTLMHGGQLTAFSAGRGTGSTFTLSLPLVADNEAGTADESVDLTPLFAVGQRRALIVDDNADAALLMAVLLTDWGLVTQISSDGPAALLLLKEGQFDIGLLDIGLPGLDGYELARTIRQDPRHQEMRLIAVTGYGQETDRRRSSESGFEKHFVKPVDMSLLRQILS